MAIAPIATAASVQGDDNTVVQLADYSEVREALDIEQLRGIIARQSEQLQRQSRLIDEQRESLEKQNERISALEDRLDTVGADQPRQAVYSPPQVISKEGKSNQVGRIHVANTTVGQPPDGEAGDDAATRDLAGVYEAGGVLTGRGNVVIEPAVEFSQSNINRFFFQGLEVVETVLVGNIEATDSDRDTIVGSGTVRYGITNFSEVEVKVPYVYRRDRITRTIVSAATSTTRTVEASGLGDVEVAGRYQINQGNGGWPIFIVNARGKTPTGEGPFEVSRDATGIETELPTGSGFWAAEGGMTVLYPSDPAVFFATAKYLWHMSRSIDKMIGGSVVGEVDPGDVVGLSFGMGFGINEEASFSLSYEHNFVMPTTTEINGTPVESESLDVGAVGLGFSYAFSPMVSANVSVQAGVTEDAPDVRLMLRVPVRFSVHD